MKNLILTLKNNSKVSNIKTTLKPSLEDEPQIKEMTVIIKTARNLYEYAKCLVIKPTENNGIFLTKIWINDDPSETLLAEMFADHKASEYIKAKYGHDHPFAEMNLNEKQINQCINFIYSKIN